jgi:hypothetical protein
MHLLRRRLFRGMWTILESHLRTAVFQLPIERDYMHKYHYPLLHQHVSLIFREQTHQRAMPTNSR